MLLFGPERVNQRGYSVPLGILLILWVLEVRVLPAMGKVQVEGDQDRKSEPRKQCSSSTGASAGLPDDEAYDLTIREFTI